jgi:hypothetical protein
MGDFAVLIRSRCAAATHAMSALRACVIAMLMRMRPLFFAPHDLRRLRRRRLMQLRVAQRSECHKAAVAAYCR